MDWPLIILIMFASLIILMLLGFPVFIAFMLINIVGVLVFFGGTKGLEQLIISMYSSLSTFTLLPILLFILMGELMFHSGIAIRMIDVLDKWLGRLPGRLSLLAVGAGTVLSTLTGASMASTAILGSTLVPEMEKRGYNKAMSLGPVLGSGGLAIMIPPSSLAVLLGAIGQISVGRILVAIIVPGLVMASLYATYIITRCWLRPSTAPSYEVPSTPLSEKLIGLVRYVMPLGIVVFLVIGVIFLGIATPAESAASGSLGVLIVLLIHRRLNWEVVKKSTYGTLRVTVMIFVILAGAQVFSQILAFSGATYGLSNLASSLPVAPILIVIAMQFVVLIMGGFMSLVAIMMITLPLFVPVITALNFDPVWFAVIFLINMEMAVTTPPLGMNLYVMKGVVRRDITMGDIIRAALPFLGCDLIAMALIIGFPVLALWLPGLMR